jgi:hypothetical protein
MREFYLSLSRQGSVLISEAFVHIDYVRESGPAVPYLFSKATPFLDNPVPGIELSVAIKWRKSGPRSFRHD